jgi:hypothetical protein
MRLTARGQGVAEAVAGYFRPFPPRPYAEQSTAGWRARIIGGSAASPSANRNQPLRVLALDVEFRNARFDCRVSVGRLHGAEKLRWRRATPTKTWTQPTGSKFRSTRIACS